MAGSGRSLEKKSDAESVTASAEITSPTGEAATNEPTGTQAPIPDEPKITASPTLSKFLFGKKILDSSKIPKGELKLSDFSPVTSELEIKHKKVLIERKSTTPADAPTASASAAFASSASSGSASAATTKDSESLTASLSDFAPATLRITQALGAFASKSSTPVEAEEKKDEIATDEIVTSEGTMRLIEELKVTPQFIASNPVHQENFIAYHQNSVGFAVDFIPKMRSPEDALKLFLLLARNRGDFARASHHKLAPIFGALRSSSDDVSKTSTIGRYDRFALSPMLDKSTLLTIVIEGHQCTDMNIYEWTHYPPPDNCLIKLANKYYELCKLKIILDEKVTDEKAAAIEKFAAFHWMAANYMPWERGSAAILDQLMDALFIHHFKWVPNKFPGDSMDCRAMCEPDCERYAKNYLKFRPLPEEKTRLFDLINEEKIETTDIEFFRRSIKRNPLLLTSVDGDGKTLLEKAFEKKKLPILKLLLINRGLDEREEDIYFRMQSNEKINAWAAENGLSELVEKLEVAKEGYNAVRICSLRDTFASIFDLLTQCYERDPLEFYAMYSRGTFAISIYRSEIIYLITIAKQPNFDLSSLAEISIPIYLNESEKSHLDSINPEISKILIARFGKEEPDYNSDYAPNPDDDPSFRFRQ